MSTESSIVTAETYRSRQELAEAPAISTDSLLTAIERVASNPNIDIERMRELVALKRDLDSERARRAFDNAIAAAKAQIKPIIKKREVDFTSTKGRTHYKYEDLAAVADAIDPALAEQGLSYRHRAMQEGKKLTITCVLSHRDGHSEETSLSADYDESGNKNLIQGVASTATYLQRYTLKLALGLSAAVDDDGNKGGAEGVEYVNDEQLAEIKRLGEEIGADKEKFLKTIMVEDVTKIPATSYPAVIALLKAKRAAQRPTAEIKP